MSTVEIIARYIRTASSHSGPIPKTAITSGASQMDLVLYPGSVPLSGLLDSAADHFSEDVPEQMSLLYQS